MLQLSCLTDSIAIDNDLWPYHRCQSYTPLFILEDCMALLYPDSQKQYVNMTIECLIELMQNCPLLLKYPKPLIEMDLGEQSLSPTSHSPGEKKTI